MLKLGDVPGLRSAYNYIGQRIVSITGEAALCRRGVSFHQVFLLKTL